MNHVSIKYSHKFYWNQQKQAHSSHFETSESFAFLIFKAWTKKRSEQFQYKSQKPDSHMNHVSIKYSRTFVRISRNRRIRNTLKPQKVLHSWFLKLEHKNALNNSSTNHKKLIHESTTYPKNTAVCSLNSAETGAFVTLWNLRKFCIPDF